MALYIIRQIGTDFLKIGRSENPFERMLALQTGSPRPLELVCVIDIAEVGESDLHSIAADTRCMGEWFAADQEFYRRLWRGVAQMLAKKRVDRKCEDLLDRVSWSDGTIGMGTEVGEQSLADLERLLDVSDERWRDRQLRRDTLRRLIRICVDRGATASMTLVEALNQRAA